MKLEDIINDSKIASVVRVHAALKLKGAGFQLTSKDLLDIVPGISPDVCSCSLSSLTRRRMLKVVSKDGRNMTWQVLAKLVKAKISVRAAPKKYAKGAHQIPEQAAQQPWHGVPRPQEMNTPVVTNLARLLLSKISDEDMVNELARRIKGDAQ